MLAGTVRHAEAEPPAKRAKSALTTFFSCRQSHAVYYPISNGHCKSMSRLQTCESWRRDFGIAVGGAVDRSSAGGVTRGWLEDPARRNIIIAPKLPVESWLYDDLMEEDPDVWKNQVTEVNGELPAVISLALTQVKKFSYICCVYCGNVCAYLLVQEGV